MAEKFSKVLLCAKCGGGNISTRFVASPSDIEEAKRRLRLGLPPDGELMQRGCGKCGYVWAERPLDHKEPENG